MRRMDWHVLTRQELFDLVWSVPMRTLAQRYGITDVALGKRCKRHGIPKPGVGYWARIAAGQKAKRPRLPKVESAFLERIIFKRLIPSTVAEPRAAVPTVAVSARLENPHEATRWVQERIDAATKDKFGRHHVAASYLPDFSVRPVNVKRALLLLDTVLKALIERGHGIVVEPYYTRSEPQLIAVVFGERLVLQIEERVEKKPHSMTPAENAKATLYPRSQIPKWDHYVDGRLCIRLFNTRHHYSGRGSWMDTKTKKLDELLGRVVLGIEVAARREKALRIEEERQKAERLAEQRRQVRGERLQWYEGWMARELENLAADWARARQLREFLTAYESVKKPVAAAAEWLLAARHYADALDPLTNGTPVASQLEPSDEVLEQLIEEDRQRGKRPP